MRADLVGLSEDTTCYVSMDYFKPNSQFDDFVVHEAAHILHNCKRRTIGLPEIGGRERLLDIEFGKRETFAYACEGYSRIRELGRSVAAHRGLFLKLENGPTPPDDRVIARGVPGCPWSCGRRSKWMETNSAELQTE